jgi:HEPN domain-containing protein
MKKKDLLKQLDEIQNEVIEIVANRNLSYIDDLDMLDSDINSDYENDRFEEMSIKELEEYVRCAQLTLDFYKGGNII